VSNYFEYEPGMGFEVKNETDLLDIEEE